MKLLAITALLINWLLFGLSGSAQEAGIIRPDAGQDPRWAAVFWGPRLGVARGSPEPGFSMMSNGTP